MLRRLVTGILASGIAAASVHILALGALVVVPRLRRRTT